MQAEALYRLGLVHLERGDLAVAEDHGFRVLDVAQAVGDVLRQAFGHLLLARLAMRRGAPQAAIPVLQQLEQQGRTLDATAYVVLVRRYLAEAHLLAGEAETASVLAREGSELAGRCGLKREQGGLLRVLGEALLASGQVTEGERQLQAAAALAERIGCRYDLAETRCRLVSTLSSPS